MWRDCCCCHFCSLLHERVNDRQRSPRETRHEQYHLTNWCWLARCHFRCHLNERVNDRHRSPEEAQHEHTRTDNVTIQICLLFDLSTRFSNCVAFDSFEFRSQSIRTTCFNCDVLPATGHTNESYEVVGRLGTICYRDFPMFRPITIINGRRP